MNATRSRRRIAANLALAFLLALTLAACGGGSDDADVVSQSDDPASTTATTDGGGGDTTTTEDGGDDTTTTTTDGGDDTTTTTEDDGGDDPPAGGVEDVLLTLDDLPAGYTEDEGASDDDSSSMEEAEAGLCGGTPENAFPAFLDQAERQFQTEDYSVVVASIAGRLDADATEAIEWFRSEAVRCADTPEGEVTVRDLDGIGDAAVQLEAVSEAFPILISLAAVDDTLVGVTLLAETGDELDIEDLLTTMVGRA